MGKVLPKQMLVYVLKTFSSSWISLIYLEIYVLCYNKYKMIVWQSIQHGYICTTNSSFEVHSSLDSMAYHTTSYVSSVMCFHSIKYIKDALKPVVQNQNGLKQSLLFQDKEKI